MSKSKIIDQKEEFIDNSLPEMFLPKRKKIKRIPLNNEGLINSDLKEEQIFLENGKRLLK